MALPDLEQVVQGTVVTIQGIYGIGTVDSTDGGASTWSKVPAPKQSYWIVNHQFSEGSGAGVGGTSGMTMKRMRKIVVDGWMPWSFALSTSEEWRRRMQMVLDQLDTHRRVAACARMIGMPDLETNRIEPYTSFHVNDLPTLCHHCKFSFQVVMYRPVTQEQAG